MDTLFDVRRHPALRRLALAALMASASLLANATGAQASQFYEDALVRFEKKDFAGAVIQLKNVLKTDNRNLSAQVLLGRALLENSEFGPAEVAFTEALRLGVNRAEVVIPLGRALVNQGKPEELLSGARFSVDGLPRTTLFQLQLLRAGAATEMGDIRSGLRAIEEARAIDAINPEGWIGEVPIRIRAGQPKEALLAADKAIALAPMLAQAHYARGEALHIVPDLKGALSSYDKALALDAGHLGAHVARAGLYLDLNRIDDAARDVAAIARIDARDPRGLYLRSIIAERQGRGADARAALNELTAMLDPVPLHFLRYRPQIQMLGGMAHHGLGQFEKAKPYLEGVLRANPAHPVSKVLASIHLTERNVDRAIETLESYGRANPGDAQAMLLLASAHMTQGRHSRATQIMQDALKLGDQAQLRTALGLSLIGGARYTDAMRELESAFAKDPDQVHAGFALASLYVQAGQGKQALRVAEALNKSHPVNAAVLDLLGTARRISGDLGGARMAFTAAAEADLRLTTAHVNLARLEMQAQALPKAAAHLSTALALNDKNVETLGAMAELAERNKDPAEAQRWLSKADEHAGPNNTAPALAMVDFHLRHQQPAQAREAVNRAMGKAPEAVSTLVAGARVALAESDSAVARSTLARAATAAGYNAPLLTQIALLQNQAGAATAAAYSLDKALGDRPDYLPALALRAELDIRQGDLSRAEQRARMILGQQARIGLGHALLGDVAMARGQRDAALAAYRKAHELDRSGESLMRLFAATVPRDPAAAVRLAEQWLTTRPQDAVIWRAMADTQFLAGNLPGARRSYEAVLKLQPQDAESMNNLAHVLLLLQDPGAQKMAEAALAQAPSTAHIIGTAGWAAFRVGQNDRAIQLLREARLRDPGNADTRYFLGNVLAALGRPGEAREELRASLQSNLSASHRAKAEDLLKSLK